MTTGKVITRRDFIRGTAYGTVGLAMGIHSRGTDAGETQNTTKAVVVRDEDALDESFRASRKTVRAMLDRALLSFRGGRPRWRRGSLLSSPTTWWESRRTS